MSFSTPEVAVLFDELKGWSHPEHPFLDPRYSPGGHYPVTDFTSVVAGWIADGKFTAIAELWSCLTWNGTAEKHLLQRALEARIDSRWGVDAASTVELLAINLLAARMALQDNSLNRCSTEHVATDLAATRLASVAWHPPTDVLEVLRDNAAIHADVEDGPKKKLRKMEKADVAIAELMRDVPEDVNAVGQWMVLIPPMSRLVVLDYFTRGWGSLALRPELYYDERQYGCCVGINLHYIQWVGCFQEPTDEDDPRGITKAHLAEALRGVGINTKKSAKHGELVSLARSQPGLLASLLKSYAPNFVRPKNEWKNGLHDWVLRWKKLRCVAGAMLSHAAQSSMPKRLR